MSDHDQNHAAEQHTPPSRTTATIALAVITGLFVLSVAMAVSQISSGVRTAATGKLHAPIAAPETTGSGHRS